MLQLSGVCTFHVACLSPHAQRFIFMAVEVPCERICSSVAPREITLSRFRNPRSVLVYHTFSCFEGEGLLLRVPRLAWGAPSLPPFGQWGSHRKTSTPTLCAPRGVAPALAPSLFSGHIPAWGAWKSKPYRCCSCVQRGSITGAIICRPIARGR